MRQIDRWLLLLAVSVLLFPIILGSWGCSEGSGSSASTTNAALDSPGTEKTVSLDFSLPTVEGDRVDLSQFDGKVRVIDFWATWCPPCRVVIPHLNEMERKYGDQGFAVVGISVDENPKMLAAFYEEQPFEYTSLLTSDEAEQAFGGVIGLPSTFVLDREGHIYSSYVGLADPETLEEDVKKLLARE